PRLVRHAHPRPQRTRRTRRTLQNRPRRGHPPRRPSPVCQPRQAHRAMADHVPALQDPQTLGGTVPRTDHHQDRRNCRVMNPFHEHLAHIGLAAANRYGFALAGGYAMQANGFLNRPSEDVDLFMAWHQRDDFDTAVTAIIEAYGANGLTV